MVFVIGLTGSIAAGKSTVGQILASRGAVHCDADKLVHGLYAPGTLGFDKVVGHFGQEVVGPDGFVDRKILGAKVFGKPDEMRKLTSAMGNISEAIHAEINKWRDTLGADDIAVMEAVNLLEPGYSEWCDQSWIIGVDDAVARVRLLETRGMSEAEAEQRIKAMVPLERRAPACDWVYKNNGTREELEAAVNGELERVLALFKAGTLPSSVFNKWWEDTRVEREKRLAEMKAKQEAEAAKT